MLRGGQLLTAPGWPNSTIDVRGLKASQDVVTVTRRGGFLSAAARRLMEIVRKEYPKEASGE